MSDAPIQSYRDLRVWREAMSLAEEAYRFTKSFPREEMFGLTSQIRRAHALLAQRVLDNIGSPTALLDQCDAVGKMLHGLIRSLQ